MPRCFHCWARAFLSADEQGKNVLWGEQCRLNLLDNHRLRFSRSSFFSTEVKVMWSRGTAFLLSPTIEQRCQHDWHETRPTPSWDPGGCRCLGVEQNHSNFQSPRFSVTSRWWLLVSPRLVLHHFGSGAGCFSSAQHVARPPPDRFHAQL